MLVELALLPIIAAAAPIAAPIAAVAGGWRSSDSSNAALGPEDRIELDANHGSIAKMSKRERGETNPADSRERRELRAK